MVVFRLLDGSLEVDWLECYRPNQIILNQETWRGFIKRVAENIQVNYYNLKL